MNFAIVSLVSMLSIANQQHCPPVKLTGTNLSLQGTNCPTFSGNTWISQRCPNGVSLLGPTSKFAVSGAYEIGGNISVVSTGNLNFAGDMSVGCCSNVTIGGFITGDANSKMNIGDMNRVKLERKIAFAGTGRLVTMDGCQVDFSDSMNRQFNIGDMSEMNIGSFGSVFLGDNFSLTRSVIFVDGNDKPAESQFEQIPNLYGTGSLYLTDCTLFIGKMATFQILGIHRYNNVNFELRDASHYRWAEVNFGTSSSSTAPLLVRLGFNSELSVDTNLHCQLVKSIDVPDNANYTLDNIRDSVLCY